MRQHRLSSPHRQQGMTLVIALIFLVLLTLLGTTIAANNSLQERMAGNTRQRDLAFQAAEHALNAADTQINNPVSAERAYINAIVAGTTPPPQPAHLLLNGQAHPNDAAYWKDTFNWTTTASLAVTGIPSTLASANPRYTIEQMPSAACPEDASDTCFYYRATARGLGRDANAVVIVQAMYKFK